MIGKGWVVVERKNIVYVRYKFYPIDAHAYKKPYYGLLAFL